MQPICMLYASHGQAIMQPLLETTSSHDLCMTVAAWHKRTVEEKCLVRPCTNGMPQEDAGYLLVHRPWLRQAQTLPFCALSYLFILFLLLCKACFGSG